MISLCRRSISVVSALFAIAFFFAVSAQAQTPVVIPNTITTIWGGSTATATVANTACPASAQFTATDTLGDGCPAINGTSQSGDERSMVVDPQGNIYFINDSVNPQSVRRIDQRSGLVSIYAGFGAGGSLCGSPVTVFGTVYTQTDKTGSGCPVVYSGGFNGARGLGMTPYGNVIITVTGDGNVNFVCNAVSPLCTAAQVRVNLMRSIAGCTPAAASYGTAVAGTTVGTAGDGTQATQFSGTCTVGVNTPRQGVGDQWENIYFADNTNQRIRVVLGAATATINGVSTPNPLYAVLQSVSNLSSPNSATNYSTPTQGYIYPIAGGGTVCSGKTDAGGDGCPFNQTVTNTSTQVQGLAVDNAGNFYFADGLGRLRVIYMASSAVNAALTAEGISSPQIGYSYALIGNGGSPGTGTTGGTSLFYNTAAFSPAYNLGKNVSLQSGSTQRLAVDSVGNIYIGDQAQILFFDIYTGYVHRFGGATTATSCNASAIGDGCPVTQSLFGAANSVLSLAFDGAGNLYVEDLTNKSIRRVSATLLPTSAVNGSLTSKIMVHAPVAASGYALSYTNTGDISIGAVSCASNATDGSNECSATATYAPTLLAQRTVPFTIAATTPSFTINSGLAANSTGSALVFDTAGTPSTTVFGTLTTGNTALVMDGVGNQYVSGTQGITKIAGISVSNISATPATYLAVDTQGNIYAANAGATSITKYSFTAPGSYTPGSVAIPLVAINGTSTTQGNTGPMVVDQFGTIYIADTTNKQLFKFVPNNGLGIQLTQTALTSPTAMSADTYGNLLIIDGTNVLKVPAGGLTISTSSPIANPKYTFTTPLTAPTSVAADQGGNLYVADSGNIIALSYAGNQYTIPNITGSAVAVDGAGNLYLTKSSVAGVTKVTRNAESHDFGTDVSTPYVGAFLNTGGTAATGFNQTDTGGNYSFLTPASPLAATGATCSIATTALGAGGLCNISIQFAPTAVGSGAVPNVVTLLPTPSLGSLSLNGTKNGSTATTTTVITGNTAGLIYSTGTETTFTVTVSQSTGTPSGVVAVQIDGGTAVNYTLAAATASTATATVTISGLTAISHTIAANYAGSPGIAGSTTTSPTSFTIGKAGTSVSWIASGSNSQQVGQAIGNSLLNATSVGNIPGAFTYTATLGSNSPTPIDASSYLPIGIYSLGVTFTPTDLVDYTSSTGSFPTYIVTKATTTAGVGASQFVVASDGSGNYSSVQAAVNALGASGGSVYIRPGTYNGFIFVVQPNVSLRGLGGDPTAVILTHEAGAFGGTGVNSFAGEFTAANSNGAQLPAGSTLASGDEGSSTLIVARSTNTAVSSSQLTPFNFYADNLTINNTYNTDTVTTTTTQSNGSTCATNAGTAATYNSLFNSGKQCASQALAIWVTGDQAIFNNVYTASLQDTVYAGSGGCGSPCTVSRQYWWRGKITGTVDYIFGDAAAVFDHDNIYTVPHGTGVAGTATIEAQNKQAVTGGGSDYLSGYVFNHTTFTSFITGMNGLEYGRPYGPYSTTVLLNSYVDQVAPAGWIEFSGQTNLPTSTYVEYNTTPYTDPATGAADVNGVIYVGTGGSIGAGVTGTRETTSQDPGYSFSTNTIKTQITAAQAAQFYPLAFLGTKVGAGGVGTLATGSSAVWDPTAALTTGQNAFVPTGTSASIASGTSITILMRPQTLGGGILPTGTYTLKDGTTTIASGSLDASGEAYYTTSSLASGPHSLTWVYGGDTNFTGSTTTTPLVVTVSGPINTGTALSVTNSTSTYGTAVTGSVTVTPAFGSGVPTGTVTFLVNAVSTGTTCTLSAGTCTYSISGIPPGSPTLTASYGGDTNYNGSTSTGSSLTINKEPVTVTLGNLTQTYTGSQLSPTVSAVVTSTSAPVTVSGVTYTCTYPPTNATTPLLTNVGSCVVSANVSLAPSSVYYSYTAPTTATFTVAPAPLTVTANSTSRVYGAANPTFTAGYTGQQGTEAFTATASSSAVPASPVVVGGYPIVPAVVAVAPASLTNYTPSLVNGTLTITQATSSVTLAQTVPSTVGVGTGVSTTFVATVNDSSNGSTGTPTGNVQFLDGTTVLGTIAISGSTATLTTTFTTTGTHSITAVYQGDTNFTGNTSAVLSESVGTPGFTASASPSSLTIARGSTGTSTLTFTPTGNYQGTLALACNGLPAFVSCIFNPSSITFTGNNAVQTSTLTVYTLNATDKTGASSSGLFWIPAFMLACVVAMRRRKLARGLRALTMLVIAALALTAMTGCGSSASFVTPTGSTTVTVVAAATGTGGDPNSTQNITLNITVTP